MEQWEYMKAGDAISGSEGTLYGIIDGETVTIAECKSITAKITKTKRQFKALGYRGAQHRAVGWEGTGSLAVYYATSRWTKLMLDYVKNGKDSYFSLQITNEDPTSAIGRQTVTLFDVNLDETEIAKLNVDSEYLDQQMNFTFSGAALLDEFKELNS